MNETLYTHQYHGRIVLGPDGKRRSAAALRCAALRAENFARLAGLVGKVIAGYDDASGKCWVGTVARALKKDGGRLVVVTRGGVKLTVSGGEETTFEKWDAVAADPENSSLTIL